LYVVLGGKKYQSVMDMFSGSYVMRLTSIVILGALIAGAILGGWLFGRVTRPLRQLRQRVHGYGEQGVQSVASQPVTASGIPEIDDLGGAFETMRQQLAEQFAQLDQNDRLRRELIANVSHDLRTPLAAMQGYVETLMLKDAEFNADERSRYLAIAHNHTQQLSRLVTELFDLAKMDSGAVQPALDAFSLTELLQDVVQEFQLLAREQQVSLELAGVTSDLWVRGDIGLIQRVCENLVSNALRHTPVGGAVRFGVEMLANRVEVTLTDTGCGIPAEDLPWIFDRYYRVSSVAPERSGLSDTELSNTQEGQGIVRGTGLGLAIVKKILELHDSAIQVESAVDRGTTFRFNLEGALA
ncbi:MAG: sensor histidine kinase, partial [Pseudomonadales bacterium]